MMPTPEQHAALNTAATNFAATSAAHAKSQEELLRALAPYRNNDLIKPGQYAIVPGSQYRLVKSETGELSVEDLPTLADSLAKGA